MGQMLLKCGLLLVGPGAQARQMEAHARAWEYEAATLVRGARLEAETRALGGRDAVEVAANLQVKQRSNTGQNWLCGRWRSKRGRRVVK